MSEFDRLCLPGWPLPAASSPRPDGRRRVAEVVSALSGALDLSTGQPVGHSIRACILGMRIAREIGMETSEQHDLYYALLLKDAGCSSNASTLFRALGSDELKAKHDVKTTDWTRQQPTLVVNQLGTTPTMERGGLGGGGVGPFSVNGQQQPTMTMYPGEVKLWRIVNASSASGFYLANLPAGFQWRQTAQDGVQFDDQNYQSRAQRRAAWRR